MQISWNLPPYISDIKQVQLNVHRVLWCINEPKYILSENLTVFKKIWEGDISYQYLVQTLSVSSDIQHTLLMGGILCFRLRRRWRPYLDDVRFVVSVTVENRLSSSESKKLVVSRSLLSMVEESPKLCPLWRSCLPWPLIRGAVITIAKCYWCIVVGFCGIYPLYRHSGHLLSKQMFISVPQVCILVCKDWQILEL